MRSRFTIGLLVCAFALVIVACGQSEADKADAEAKAERLVALAQSKGYERLTAQIAEVVYGTSAPTVCGVLDSDWHRDLAIHLGRNPSGRIGQQISPDLLVFDRLVIEVYCPEKLPDIDEFVEDLRLVDDND